MLCDRFFVPIPGSHTQQFGQNFFALIGRFGRKFIRFTLQQKACIREGVIIHAQQLLDSCLRLANFAFTERLPLVGFCGDLQFQHCAFALLFAPNHTVNIAFQIKSEADFSAFPADGCLAVDHIIVAATATAPKQGVGNAIQNTGLSGTVWARDTGQFDLVECEYGRITVTQKIS